MAVDPKKLVATITDQCEHIEQRTAGYRAALMDTVADILFAESEHLIRSTQIQKQVTDKCASLGQFLSTQDKSGSGEAV